MKIAIFVNDIATEDPAYTTTYLAQEAVHAGHEVWYLGAGDFVYRPDDVIEAHARRLPADRFDSGEAVMAALRSPENPPQTVAVDQFDVLLLRSDPSLDIVDRPWAYNTGLLFGQVARNRGVVVLNDPFGLSHAMNKLYFQRFPEEVRAETMVTRDRSDIRQFIDAHDGRAVLKPLQGSSGRNVFLVESRDSPNLNQMIDAVSRDGYIIVQQYLPEASAGDTRLFLMNGSPLEHNGRYAAFRRTRTSGDMRSNRRQGGDAEPAEIGEPQLRIAEIVRPRLVRDGMFLVGLDIAGSKLMEINVFSPAGLRLASKLNGADFVRIVIRNIERKVRYVAFDKHMVDNPELATL